ncbi:rhomboid family intramembrane serine protease [Alicyclobacillus acidoterrestris]|uniref:rhomboid family intramembrane serine protease n=1 Tax=Alicyclobacillus suci TaxID=2816080 RepID=UPI0011947972|nr:rhomboid family intramembrane serine protease [Alicyclobacillus suci]GEO24362.1 rhomboid family intramembrane serine protease [Alicyclobacillus acidoterrestris]
MKRTRLQVFGGGRAIAQWPASWKIIALTVIWYVVVQTIFGHSVQGDARAGAMVGVFVTHGQIFRLLTAIFVHLSLMHLLVNMVSLWTLTAVESLLGANAFVVIYLVSGLFGNVLSLAVGAGLTVSAGASGAIFGLFGAMLGLAFLRILPTVVRNQLLMILAINVVLDITHPDIDWLAHLGGMVAGILLTLVYVNVNRSVRLWRTASIIMVCLTAISLIACLVTPLSAI